MENEIENLKRITQQLEEKEAIVNGISDALMLLDAKTYEILEVNHAFLNSYGMKREEILGKRCYEVTHHLNVPCHHANTSCPCPMESSIETGKLSYAEHVHRDYDGRTLYFEITTYPLKDVSGQVDRIIHLSRDITMRKHLEEELKKSEKKYRFLFNSIPNPVFVLEAKSFKIIDCNDGVSAVYGRNKEELVNKNFLDLFEELDREHYAIEIKTSDILNQVKHMNKYGQPIYVNIYVSPSDYLGTEVLLLSITDITDRLLVEQQLIQASKMTTLGEM
ncbi:MAG: PAS domain-containing protein, partial [Desulfobacterales bacterium]